MPEERGVYPKTKIFDQLMYFAKLKGMNKQEATNAINKWAKELKVEEYLELPAEKLSKGNQQKIQFMTAIIHNPELVVLDEPFSGLDPVNTEILKNIIIDLVSRGKYVIMSAHQMATIEEFCSDILILNRGKTVLQGNLKEIKESYPANRLEIDVNENIDSYIEKFNLEKEIEKNNDYIIKISDEEIIMAKNQLQTSLDVVMDNQNSLINNYTFNTIVGTPLFKSLKEAYKNITIKDLKNLGKKLKLNFIYKLQGKEGEES